MVIIMSSTCALVVSWHVSGFGYATGSIYYVFLLTSPVGDKKHVISLCNVPTQVCKEQNSVPKSVHNSS